MSKEKNTTVASGASETAANNANEAAEAAAKSEPRGETGGTAASVPAVNTGEAPAGAAPRFTKDQLLRSNAYAGRRDLLTALLEDGKTYTRAEVDALIKDFSERPVR